MSAVRQRRGAPIDDAVLDVTVDLLGSRGYEFSIDDVAAGAGVHKTTIYRRWETKAALVAAAITRLSEQTVLVENSDDPLLDLENLAVQVAAVLTRPVGRNPLRAALAAAGSDPEVASAARGFFRSRYLIGAALIEAAQNRGLIASGWDATIIWQAIANPMHMDAICGIDTTAERARTLVALVCDGARTREGATS